MDILLYAIGVYIGIGMVYLGSGILRVLMDPKNTGFADDFVKASIFEKALRIAMTVAGWPYWIYLEASISIYIRKITKRVKES